MGVLAEPTEVQCSSGRAAAVKHGDAVAGDVFLDDPVRQRHSRVDDAGGQGWGGRWQELNRQAGLFAYLADGGLGWILVSFDMAAWDHPFRETRVADERDLLAFMLGVRSGSRM